MVWNLLVSTAIAYAIVVVLVFVFQSRLVFYPEMGRAITVTPQAYGLAFDPVRIRTADGETLAAWWVPAATGTMPARGTVLFLHGNAGNISHRMDYLQMFHRIGYATLIVDYRGYGESTGSPSESGTYEDAAASWRWLVEARAVRPSDIVVFGESLGGAVASWLAAREAPRVLVLASTFTSATELGAEIYRFLPVRWISRIGYDSLARLPEISAPVLIAHSPHDEIVPFAHGRRLFAAAREPKRFLALDGGHNDGFIFMRPEWVRALAEFLAQSEPAR